MPNHVYTNLEVTGTEDDITQFKFRFCETIDNLADCLVFNKVIPMPASLDVECGSRSSTGFQIVSGDFDELFDLGWVKELVSKDNLTPEDVNKLKSSREDFITWFSKHQPETIELGKIVSSNLVEHGYQSWYDWRIHHWGTKWDAYSHTVQDTESTKYSVYFHTAWSPAIPVLEAMSEAFPNLSFRMAYADEGGGFAGVAHAKGGIVSDVDEDYQTVCENEFGFDFGDESELDLSPILIQVIQGNP